MSSSSKRFRRNLLEELVVEAAEVPSPDGVVVTAEHIMGQTDWDRSLPEALVIEYTDAFMDEV